MVESRSIEFKLDYSKKSYAIGEGVVASNVIFAGGRSWWVVCYPRGSNALLSDNGAYLSLSVVTMGKSKDVVKAIFDAVVLGADGAPSSSLPENRSERVTYTPDGAHPVVAGWHKFMKRSDLESYCLVDGSVTFVCRITVLHEHYDDPIPVPASDLGNHLGHLLDCAAGSDVSFSVGGETFRAHRAVLAARSPVFKAQLLGSMADAKMGCITLHDDIKTGTFRALLRFMYTDALPTAEDDRDLEGSSTTPTELLQHLLAAADMYRLDRLKLMCAQKLWEGLSSDTVAAILGCAEMHNCPELKKKCIDFVVEKNFKNAVLTEGYLQLLQSFPSVIDEIRARVVQS